MHKIIFLYYRIGKDLVQLQILENEYGMLYKQIGTNNKDVLIDVEGNCYVMPIKMGNKPPRWFTINILQHATFKSINLNEFSPNFFEVMHIGHEDLNKQTEGFGKFVENQLHIWRSNVTDSSYNEFFFPSFFSSSSNDYQHQFNHFFNMIGKEE